MMEFLNSMDGDELFDLLHNYKRNGSGFTFEAPAEDAPGVYLSMEWEDDVESIFDLSRVVSVLIDPDEAENYTKPPADLPVLEFTNGPPYNDIDEEVGVVMDTLFRESIHESPTEHLRLDETNSTDSLHVYTATVNTKVDCQLTPPEVVRLERA